jgi:hypothetical protein
MVRGCADYFDAVSQADIDSMIKVNVVGVTRVCDRHA